MNNEIVSLNLADLEVTEIEHRFEMAVAMVVVSAEEPSCNRCGFIRIGCNRENPKSITN